MTLEALARALYETDAGTTGHPPLHTTIPWDERRDPSRFERPSQYDRAEKILRIIGRESAHPSSDAVESTNPR